MHIRCWLVLGFMLGPGGALAQVAAPAPAPVLSADEARAQRARGKSLKAEAEARYEAEKAECQARVIAVGSPLPTSSAKLGPLSAPHRASSPSSSATI